MYPKPSSVYLRGTTIFDCYRSTLHIPPVRVDGGGLLLGGTDQCELHDHVVGSSSLSRSAVTDYIQQLHRPLGLPMHLHDRSISRHPLHRTAWP